MFLHLFPDVHFVKNTCLIIRESPNGQFDGLHFANVK